MKHSNIKSNSNIQDKLKWAFEEGYKLGREDGREGVFISIPSLVEQFAEKLPEDIDLSLTKTAIPV